MLQSDFSTSAIQNIGECEKTAEKPVQRSSSDSYLRQRDSKEKYLKLGKNMNCRLNILYRWLFGVLVCYASDSKRGRAPSLHLNFGERTLRASYYL